MFELDKYTIKARLYPSFLVLIPAFVICVYYIPGFAEYYHYIITLIGVGLITFLLSQLGRDFGKKKEPKLHEYFGGKPTTQILRHRNSYIDKVTKVRYHELLSNKIDGLQIPTIEEEVKDMKSTDEVYESCIKYLISKTRDTEKFKLLYKENINYGFRRNLWGMKPWALFILLFCFCIHSYFSTKYFTVFNQFEQKDIALFFLLIVTTLFWIFIVTKDWIKIPSFAYAERLLETLNEI